MAVKAAHAEPRRHAHGPTSESDHRGPRNHEPETRSVANISTSARPPAGDVFLADAIVRNRPDASKFTIGHCWDGPLSLEIQVVGEAGEPRSRDRQPSLQSIQCFSLRYFLWELEIVTPARHLGDDGAELPCRDGVSGDDTSLAEQVAQKQGHGPPQLIAADAGPPWRPGPSPRQRRFVQTPQKPMAFQSAPPAPAIAGQCGRARRRPGDRPRR